MLSLYRLFLTQSIRQWFLFVIISIVIIFILSRFFTDYGYLLLGPFWISCAIVGLQSGLISKNLSWILAMPISKKKILLLNYLFSLSALVLFLLSNSVVAIGITLIKNFHIIGFKPVFNAQAYTDSFSGIGNLIKSPQFNAWFRDNAIELVTFAIICFSFLHMLCMNMYNSSALKRFHSSLWHHPDLKSRRLYRAVLILFSLSGVIGISLFSSGFGQILVWCCIFVLFPAVSASTALSMSPKQRNQLILGSLGLVAIQSLVIYSVAANDANNISSQRRVESILFLGPFGRGLARQNIANLLEGELKDDDLYRLGNFYLNVYHNGRKIRKDEDKYLRFDSVIAKKTTEFSLIKSAALFDYTSLEFSDIEMLLSKLSSIHSDQPSEHMLYALFSAKITPDEIEKLLNSKNNLAIRYALLRSRYDNNPEIIPYILNNIVFYNDELRLIALRTLSVISGHYIGLDEWVKIKTSRPHTLSMAALGLESISALKAKLNFDCNSFKFTSLRELHTTQLPLLNTCIRKLVDRRDFKLLESIEAIGWFDLVPEAKKSWALRHIFHR